MAPRRGPWGGGGCRDAGAETQRGGVDDRRGDDAESSRCDDSKRDDVPDGALVLRLAGAEVYDLWWGDYTQQPLALAIRRWAEGTMTGSARTLRDLGGFAAH